MPAAVESMAYVGEMPWHGLGTKVEPGISTEEMIKAAGLDWKVHRQRVYTKHDDEEMDELLEVDEYGMLVKSDTKQILSVCGPRYVPTQNGQVMEFFNRFAKYGHLSLETAGALNNNKMVWALAKMDDELVLPGSDVTHPYLLLASPHEWGKALTVKFTPIRVVCMNTLTMALTNFGHSVRLTHVREFDSDAQREAAGAIGASIKAFNSFKERAKLLSETKAEPGEVDIFFAKLASPKSITEDGEVDLTRVTSTFIQLRELYRAGPGADLQAANGTWWGAFNAITRYEDHVAGKTADTRLTSSWFGPKSGYKMRAFDLASEYANAA